MQPIADVEALDVADDRHLRGIVRREGSSMDQLVFSAEKTLSAHEFVVAIVMASHVAKNAVPTINSTLTRCAHGIVLEPEMGMDVWPSMLFVQSCQADLDQRHPRAELLMSSSSPARYLT